MTLGVLSSFVCFYFLLILIGAPLLSKVVLVSTAQQSE